MPSTAEGNILSGASTATRSSSLVETRSGPGVPSPAGFMIFFDITATPNNAETLTLAIDGVDPFTGKTVQLVNLGPTNAASAFGASPTTATWAIVLQPGAPTTAFPVNPGPASQPIQAGPAWKLRVVHSAGGSWTYSARVVSL